MEIDIIRYNLKEMLKNRGDDVSYIIEHGDAVEVHRYYNELIILDTDRTTVFFALNKDVLKEWKQQDEDAEAMIAKYKTKDFILVLADTPSPVMLTYIAGKDKALQEQGGMLQMFYTKDLKYNPLEHTLVPKHTKLSEAESKDLLQLYLAKKVQLPMIHKTDIIARWLGLKHGDIVKITRYNETSGEYFYYRTCV